MKKKSYFKLTASLFIVVAILHLGRVLFGLPLTLGLWVVPTWVSWLAVLVTGAFAYNGFKLNRK